MNFNNQNNNTEENVKPKKERPAFLKMCDEITQEIEARKRGGATQLTSDDGGGNEKEKSSHPTKRTIITTKRRTLLPTPRRTLLPYPNRIPAPQRTLLIPHHVTLLRYRLCIIHPSAISQFSRR